MHNFSLGDCIQERPNAVVVTNHQSGHSDSMGVTMARDTLLSRPMESTNDFRQQMLDLWRSVSMPLDKMKVTSEYGVRFHPIYHRSMAHNGIDFSAPTGTKVYAMLDGVIKRIGYDKRSGNFVIIDHGDYTVSYCHLSKVLVQVGERVKAGQITCLAGNTGASTGSHLHYGVRDKNGKWCNPKVMLDMVDKTRKTVLELIRQHGGLDA